MSKIQVDQIVNKEDTGSPIFPKGAVVTGVITATSFSGDGITATSFSGDGIQVGIVTATTTVNSNQYEGFLWVDSSLFT